MVQVCIGFVVMFAAYFTVSLNGDSPTGGAYAAAFVMAILAALYFDLRRGGW